jgi:hypothetical protein
MTNLERAEKVAEHQLAAWPGDVLPIFRVAVRDLLVATVERALDEAMAPQVTVTAPEEPTAPHPLPTEPEPS